MRPIAPIQLWLPTFFGGIARPEARADMQRMFRARTRARVMWSVPGWNGPKAWNENGTVVGCVNGESPECARILHIGRNGAVVGPAAAAFPEMSVGGLLDAWLNEKVVVFEPSPPGKPLAVEMPEVVEGGVRYGRFEIGPFVKHVLPLTHHGEEIVAAQWPPNLDMPSTVSPELETAAAAFEGVEAKTLLHMRFAWIAPFADLQPLLVSPDDIVARDRMRLIADYSAKDPAKALADAKLEARDWLSEGWATINEAWLQPIFAEEGEEGALFAIEGRYGIAVSSLDAAYSDEKLLAHLKEEMPVTRAWGVPGLMWALFIERLTTSQLFPACERCGRALSGKGDKRFCSMEENPTCYRARRAGSKRGERARGRARR